MNYRTSYRVLIACNKCHTRQYAIISKDIDNTLHFYNQICLGCGVLVMDDNDTEDIPDYDASEIIKAYDKRDNYIKYIYAYKNMQKDLIDQKKKYCRLPNQRKAVDMALERIKLRVDNLETYFKNHTDTLDLLNFKSL